MEEYINELNENQREAVLYDDGPSLVVAGAGSGKTRVLTCKIAHLLHAGYQPHSILALTFTNKAAREMKERIASLTSDYVARYLWMGTFHSIFYRILRREAEYIGYKPDFTIYDAADSKNLIKTIIKEMQLDEKIYRPEAIQHRISSAKNALITHQAYAANKELREYDARSKMPYLVEIYKHYQSRCFRAGVMDFDELLLQTNILFRDFPAVLSKYQHQFGYVLVDEYQDTNFAQHLIVRRISEQHQRIFVVGDDAQSIYSFRGANIDNMLRFKEYYPACKTFKLERNYRSTQNIVDAANSLIEKNKEQIRKTVYSENDKGNRITIVSAYSDYEEGYLVSSKILEMMRNGYSCADFAILYRTNAQSRIMEEALRQRTIKYRIYGGQSFYQRKEIKDVIAYLRVIVNPSDEISLMRIINYPTRGIGDTTVDKLQTAAVSAGTSLWDAVSSPDAYPNLSINKGTAARLHDFCLLINDCREKNEAMTAAEIIDYTISRSGISVALNSDTSIEGISRRENVMELQNAANTFVASRREEGEENTTLTDFLTEISLLTDQDGDKDMQADKVTLMTVHAAKGLEFKNVFVVGMEQDLFPSMRSTSVREIEEERRLFYVAITRARENCIITYAQNRYRNGQSNMSTPSAFLSDIDMKYLQIEEGAELPSTRHQPPSQQTYARQERHVVASPVVYGGRSYAQKTHYTPLKEASTSSSAALPAEYAGLKIGVKVLHERFGEGVIATLDGGGADAKATITFKNAGLRTLLLKYAKLKIIHS